VGLGVLLAGLVWMPTGTLDVFWNLVVPLLPISFLVSPLLWRAVCPLATLNMLSNGAIRRRTLEGNWIPRATTIGVILLFVLVPARRFLFNQDATALAVTVGAVGAAALILGLFFDAKAGFCNSICPVLPVERLYGQHPLATRVPNTRCQPCTTCSARGCIDLAPTKSIAQTLGRARRSRNWLLTPYGLFAAAFPGFIVAYFTATDGPASRFAEVYAHAGLDVVVSVGVVTTVSVILEMPSRVLMPLLGALAVGLYYWFASTTLAAWVPGPETVVAGALRVIFLGTVAAWLARALWAVRVSPDPH